MRAAVGKLKNFLKASAEPFDILVTTPGSLAKLLKEQKVYMKYVKHLVFDEADVMFSEDQGFMDELKRVPGKILVFHIFRLLFRFKVDCK